MIKRLLLLFIPLAMLSLTSCDEDQPYRPWLAGKVFTADASYNPYSPAPYWILTFDSRGGYGYEGRFSVVPYNAWGNPIMQLEYYSGYYESDWDNDRIYITYDNYSANQVWYVDTDYEQPDGWPWYSPNVIISVPYNAGGPLAGLSFYSGNYFDL